MGGARGVLPGAAGGKPDGAPNGLPGPGFGGGFSPASVHGGSRGGGTPTARRTRRGGRQSPGTGEGGDEEAGPSSGRVGPRPDCPHAPLFTPPQRAHRKLRPAGRGVPPSYPPLPAILANEQALFVTRPALRPRDPAAAASAQSKQASRVRAPPFSAVGACRAGPTPCCRTLGFSAARAEIPRAESRESSCVYTLSPVCVLFV